MKFRYLVLMAGIAVGVGLATALQANSKVASPAKKKRLLIVTHTAGFRHSSIPTAEKTLTEIGERSGLFDVAYCRTKEDVEKMLTPEGLKGFDGVFFANTTGNLGIPNLQAFLDWIKAGHAFLGAHSATDTYHPESIGGDRSYVEMIGGEFATHGRQCEVEAIVEDTRHPAVAHLGSTYKVFDEIYLFKENTRTKVKVLLSLDKHPNDGSADANKPGDYLLAWCRMYGKGRVFYTALGHREDVWESEPYRQHLLGAIRWAFGLAKGDATPGVKRTR
jgi:hypothetical protein